MNKKIWVIILALALLTILLISQVQVPSQTILSVSKVEIQPEGYVDAEGKLRGTSWIATMLTDCTDEAKGWKFNNETDRQRYYEGKEVYVSSEIEIVIDPQQPYWIRPLEVHTHRVYPKTYSTWKNVLQQVGKIGDDFVPSLSVNSYQFGARADVPNEWVVHTPFWISLKKNGVEIAKEYVDSVGMVETIKLENPFNTEEYVTLTNLGKLGTGYGQPSITDIICIERQLNYIFVGSDSVENKINYDTVDLSYSNYWFGGGNIYKSEGFKIERWEDGSPAHFYYPPIAGVNLIEDGDFPGSYRDDDYWGDSRARVVAADVWHDKPSTDPYGKSLVNYLKDFHSTFDVDIWKCGAEITDDNFLKISLPFASVNSLVTIEMSTELADTFIWTPQIANVKFESCEWQTGGSHTDIQDRLFATMKLKQHSTVKSTATIQPVLNVAGQPVAINPLAHTVDLAPDKTETVTFEFLNLGTPNDLDNSVDFIIKNKRGDETDRRTLTFTLKKKGVAETILTVYVVDSASNMKLGGIPVTISYDSSSQTGYSIGGAVVFDLEGVEGTVRVDSSETPLYNPAFATTTVRAGEPNEVTLRLVRKGVQPEPLPWWILVLVIFAVVVALLVYWYRKSKGEEIL